MKKPTVPFITLIAAVVGLIIMLIGAYIEGSPIMGFLNLPAFLIVGGGTIGSVLASVGLERFKTIGAGFKYAQTTGLPPWEETARELVRAADIARRDGLLKLESEAENVDDPFLKTAYQMLSDGGDQGPLREILWAKIETEAGELRAQADVFSKAGATAPTIGIIGAIMGLTHAMQLLDQPDKLGPAIAGAFMATLYGLVTANLLYTPTSDRIKGHVKVLREYRGLVVSAVLAIHQGQGARQVAEKIVAACPEPLDAEELRASLRDD